MKSKASLCLLLSSLFLLLVQFQVFGFSFKDWFKHWNYSFGVPIMQNTFIESSYSDNSFSLVDGFGSVYYFSFVQNDYSRETNCYLTQIMIPVFYTSDYSIGLTGIVRYFDADIINRNTFMGGCGQVYFMYNFKPGVKAYVAVGSSNYEILTTEELKEAFPGDPGFYINGEFVSIGTGLQVNGSSSEVFNISGGLKIYINSWFYTEVTAVYFPAGTIDKFTAKLGRYVVDRDFYFKPISITEDMVISINIGIGL